MPLRLVADDATTFRLIEFEPKPLGPTDVRVRVAFGAPKHGTEWHLLTGSVNTRKRWDPDLRLFLPREEVAPATAAPTSPRPVGNTVVGTVTDVGASVTRFRPGDAVFGYGGIAEVHQTVESRLFPLGDLSPEDAVCADPAHVAFVALRDGNVRIGDTVAVFGLGAIGLMTVQIARAAGAHRVFAVDPLPLRRERAEAFGADHTFDPAAGDVALEIKRATAGHGVDVSLETSGNGRALQEAVRCIRQCGTIVHVAWGPHGAADLHLDEEFHSNRPRLVASQAAPYWGNPDRDHPLWDAARAFAAAIEILRRGQATGKGVVTPTIYLTEAPERLPGLLAQPAASVKVGVAVGG